MLMSDIILRALAPIFFVMALGYSAGGLDRVARFLAVARWVFAISLLNPY
jgi:hypothetical protein